MVFLTQDEILSGVDALENIIKPFNDYKITEVCVQQLPRNEASSIERHVCLFNYPESLYKKINK